jgi:hypothetical protein
MDPPAHAVALDADKKSQIWAFDRAHPRLPPKRGRAGAVTRDHRRHSKTTLFAPMNILDVAVIGQSAQSHSHEKFI